MDSCPIKSPPSLLSMTTTVQKDLEQTTRENGSNLYYNNPSPCRLPVLINSKCGGCGGGKDAKGRASAIPRIPKQDIIEMFRYGKAEKEVTDEVIQKEILVSDLTENLKTVKEAIEKTYLAQKLTQMEIEKCPAREEMEVLLQLKCRQQQELMECLKLEDKYLNDLSCAQRAMQESRLKKQSLSLQIVNNKIDEVYNIYEAQKDQMYRQRFYRECSKKTTMFQYKHEAMKDFLDASITQEIEKHDEKSKSKSLAKKEAKSKVSYHIKNTHRRRRMMKDEAKVTQEMSQYHQKQKLLAFKAKMEEHRHLVYQHNEAHKKKAEHEERLKEFRRQTLIDQGENPYVVDEVLRVNDKIKLFEAKAFKAKSGTIDKIVQELNDQQRWVKKSKASRRRWDHFWAQKAREKKKQNYNLLIKPFLAQGQKPGTATRSDKWLKVAKDIYGYDDSKRLRKSLGAASVRYSTAVADELHLISSNKIEELGEDADDDAKTHPYSGRTLGSFKLSKHSKKKKHKDKAHGHRHDRKKDSTGSKSKSRLGSNDSSRKQSANSPRKSAVSESSGRGSTAKHILSGLEEEEDDKEYSLDTFEDSEMMDPRMSMTTMTMTLSKTSRLSDLSARKNGPFMKDALGSEIRGMHASGVSFGPGGDLKLQFVNNDSDLNVGQQKEKMEKPFFTWSPKIISFKNYDVGKVYKAKVFVVNKSMRRLKYYFKEIVETKDIEQTNIPENPPPSARDDQDKAKLSKGLLWPSVQPEHSSPASDIGSNAAGSSNVDTAVNSLANSDTASPQNPSRHHEQTRSEEHIHHKHRKHSKRHSATVPRANVLDQLVKEEYYKLSDLIKVNFTVPPPLSPGLQHSFLVTFTPKIQGDWSGHLSLYSENYTFDIPLEICKKRFTPAVIDPLPPAQVQFPPTVAGTSSLRKVRLKNIGGLSGRLDYINEPYPPQSFNEMEEYYGNGNRGSTHLSSRIPSVQSGSFSHSQNSEKNYITSEERNIYNSNVPSLEGSESTEKPADETSPTNSGKKKRNKHSISSKKEKKQKEKAPTPPVLSEEKIKTGASVGKTSTRKSSKNVEFNKHAIVDTIAGILNSLVDYVTQSVFVYYVDEMKRVMDPGEELTLSIVYRPPFVSNFTTTFHIGFPLEQQLHSHQAASSREIILNASGPATENPIYIQPANGNFKICTINGTYQQTVTAYTTCSKGSGKVRAKVPAILKEFVDVYPREASALFMSHPCQFSVKFAPKRSLMTTPDKYLDYFDPETNIIDFPIYFELKFPFKVPTPIQATFMAVLTDTLLVIDPMEINMGDCLPFETVKHILTIYNPSSVPQKVGFVDVPHEITIQPNYGFETILPEETIKWDILLSLDPLNTMKKEKEYRGQRTFQLKLQTFAKEEYAIRVKCFFKNSCLKLSHSSVTFPATCCGSIASCTVALKAENDTKKDPSWFIPRFHVDLSDDSPIKIAPTCGYIEPGTEIKLSVMLEANISDEAVRLECIALANKRFLETINAYQRELSSINLHLQNDWMLDENMNPDILNYKTSLDFVRRSSSELSEAMKRIAMRKILKPPTQRAESVRDESTVRSGSGSISGSSVATSQLSLRSNVKKKGKGKVKRAKVAKKKIAQASIVGPRADGSLKSDEGGASRPSVEQRNIKQNMLIELENRKKSIEFKLQEPFVPPIKSEIGVDSIEFIRAKRELLKKLATSCAIHQVPIYVYEHPSNFPTDLLYLTIKCPIQKPDLILLNESTDFDFEFIPIQTKVWKEISLYNVSASTLNLKMSVLNPYGPFSQSNALRPLAPEHVYTLKICFNPLDEDEFEEKLSIYGGESTIDITLRGCGDKPIHSNFSGFGTSHLSSLVPDVTKKSKVGSGDAMRSSLRTGQ